MKIFKTIKNIIAGISDTPSITENPLTKQITISLKDGYTLNMQDSLGNLYTLANSSDMLTQNKQMTGDKVNCTASCVKLLGQYILTLSGFNILTSIAGGSSKSFKIKHPLIGKSPSIPCNLTYGNTKGSFTVSGVNYRDGYIYLTLSNPNSQVGTRMAYLDMCLIGMEDISKLSDKIEIEEITNKEIEEELNA